MDSAKQMAESLVVSIERILRLEAVMLEEMRAIEARAPDELQEIIREKQHLVEQLEAETARQKQWLAQEKCGFTPDGIEQFIARFDKDAHLAGLWGQLRDSIGRCDRLNKKNARLIERDRKRVALSLRILRGDDETASTYDPYGRPARDRQQGRTISQA